MNRTWMFTVLVEEGLTGDYSDRCAVIDLGPNGTDGNLDAHALLKAKCGFHLYTDWPDICDYRGDFWSIRDRHREPT